MHFRGLNLNLLVSLDALLTEKSVTRAADRLNVTQPAMSASLQQLREYLSDPLLERVGRRLELTARGRELAVSIKELLLQVDQTLNKREVFQPGTARHTFRLAMSGHMAEQLGVPLVQRLGAEAPGVNFQISELSLDTLRRVEEGELDFGITLTQRTQSNHSYRPEVLSSAHILTDRFVLVAAEDNDAVVEGLSYEAFCLLPYIEVRFGGNARGLPEFALERQKQRPWVAAWMPTSQSVLSAVSVTGAVAIVPSRLFERHREVFRLKSVEPPLALPEINQLCFWHSRNDADPAYQWFVETMREIAARPAARTPQPSSPAGQARRLQPASAQA